MAFIFQLRELRQSVRASLGLHSPKQLNSQSSYSPNVVSPTGLTSDAPQDYFSNLPGVQLRPRQDKNNENYLHVDFADGDKNDPKNWSFFRKATIMFVLIWIALSVNIASSIESAMNVPAANYFDVSLITESSSTALYLIGLGIGSLLCSPLSELFGRYPIYIITLILFQCWLAGDALVPNFAGHLIFRFLAGLLASPSLTVSGGSISDMYTPLQSTWAFPLFAASSFGSPALGPALGAYVPNGFSWRWVQYLLLIVNGFVILLTICLMQETLAPRLTRHQAIYYRELTGDLRFMSETEVQQKSILQTVKTLARPFVLGAEPIVLALTVYLSIMYIVIFTFLDGYPQIFEKTYSINAGLSNICFLGLAIGILLSGLLIAPVYHISKKQLLGNGNGESGTLIPETRAIFAMVGAPCVPIGLLWMAWTDWSFISIWSPIIASGLVGFGAACIYLTCYMYIIDAYHTFAASALAFNALVRYLAAGLMTVGGMPLYAHLGTHWTMTLLGLLAAVAVPIPYVLYNFGHKLRQKSNHTQRD